MHSLSLTSSWIVLELILILAEPVAFSSKKIEVESLAIR